MPQNNANQTHDTENSGEKGKFTPDWLRSFEGFEQFSDEQAWEVIKQFKLICELTMDLYIKEQQNETTESI